MLRWERIAETVHTRTARPSINLTGLAHSLGISRPALTRRLNGQVAWRYDELEILAKQFNLTVEQLAGQNHEEVGT